MRPTKTLNVDPQLHQQLNEAAAKAGVKIYTYVEAALAVGLSRPNDVKRLLEERTSSGQAPEQGR